MDRVKRTFDRACGVIAMALIAIILCGGCAHTDPKCVSGLSRPDYAKFNAADAVRFNQVAKQRLQVYQRLAEYLIERFELTERPGVGIDIGGGPGDLVLELAARTKEFYWINTDINTWYARPFAEDALKRELAQRTGFVFADACALPFRDRYADLIVSRGAYQFWGNLEDGIREVHRVLKPGGWAFIGRGFPPTMPEHEVRALREKHVVGGPAYDPDEDAARFRALMPGLKVVEYEVIRHTPSPAAGSYGVWLCFRRNGAQRP
jgi:SAM-dependent methyltransferase